MPRGVDELRKRRGGMPRSRNHPRPDCLKRGELSSRFMTARILFFLGALALAGSAGLRAQGTVTIDAAGTATPVASGFAGVSVEMSNVGTWAGTYDPAFPALFDSSLVNLLNLLGLYEGPPVVRIGGNSQDRTWLQTSSTASPPAFAYTAAPTLNPITPAQVNGLAWVQRLPNTRGSFHDRTEHGRQPGFRGIRRNGFLPECVRRAGDSGL